MYSIVSCWACCCAFALQPIRSRVVFGPAYHQPATSPILVLFNDTCHTAVTQKGFLTFRLYFQPESLCDTCELLLDSISLNLKDPDFDTFLKEEQRQVIISQSEALIRQQHYWYDYFVANDTTKSVSDMIVIWHVNSNPE